MNGRHATGPLGSRRIRWPIIGIGVAISLLLHGLVLWPLFGRWLGQPPDAAQRARRPMEVVFEKEPPPPEPVAEPDKRVLAEASARQAPKVKPELRRPRPDDQKKELLAKLTPKPRKRLRLRLRPPAPPRPPKPRPKPKAPKKRAEPPKPLKLKMFRMKSVDQDYKKNEPPPKDAKYLAAKNRNVKQQTRARSTNLDKHYNKTQLTAKSRKEIGSLTRQTRNATRIPRKAVDERAGAARKGPRPKKELVAKRRPQPEQRPQKSTLLQMRNRRPNQDQKVLRAERVVRSPDGILRARKPVPKAQKLIAAGRPGQRARKRLKLRLTQQDADRIFGKQWAQQWKQRHARRGSKSTKRNQRWAKIKAALANYIPEVKVGNQTALKTRAHPFARYIAKMHRKIHPRWGDGFLVDLDRLPAHDKFNDFNRWTKLEIVLNNRGQVVKAGVVKPSGFLAFDVAALDVVFSAAPFGPPPRAIVSYNGKVYLHWEFWRNHRQCGTFGANPFILATPKKTPVDKGAGPGGTAKQHRYGRALSRRGREVRRRVAAAARKAAPHRSNSLDSRARAPAASWLVGFVQGKPAKMVQASALPFRASGKIVARTPSQLLKVYRALVAETADRRLTRVMRLLSASGLRTRLGTLPRGVRPGSSNLYVVARVGNTDLVLILGRATNSRWAVIGLAR